MIDLPPLVSKGSPIRAADQNKLINAVRGLAASNVAGMRGGNMQRSRFRGKKHPFEVEVVAGPAGSGEAVIRVHPGTWHGNGAPGEVTSGSIERYLDGLNTEDGVDAWIVGNYNEDSRTYEPVEFSVADGIHYVVLSAGVSNGKINGVSLSCRKERPEPNQRLDSGLVETVVAQVEVKIEDNTFKSAVVLQVLGGDFWAPSGGEGGESYAGNPFAWTKVGENTWQLRKVVLMVTPHQIYGTDGVSGVNVMFDAAGDVYSPMRNDTIPSYDTAPIAPNSYSVVDGLCVGADMDDGAAVLVYAEVDGERNLSWCVHDVYNIFDNGSTEGLPFPLPWSPQQMTAAITFDITRSLAGNAYDLGFRLEGRFDDATVARFRVSVPMAIIARNGDSTTLVPIRHGMIEVRPALALGFRMYQGTEFAYAAIDRNDIAGVWGEPTVSKKEFVD